MRQKGGHGLKARIKINDIPQAQIDILNRSTYTVEIKDTVTGKVESRVTRPMRSFTANFLRLLWGRMTGTACTGGLDINDTAIDESSGKATNLKCVGATTGLKKFGVCIGTGTGAVAQTDNKLTWDTGFSIYGATTLKTPTTISGSDIYFEIQKAFTNNTGSTRTIYEAGLCTTGEGTEADNNTNVLIAREITNGATGTAVATGKTLTVVFKISSTFTTDGVINKTFMRQLLSAFLNDTGARWVTETASAAWAIRYGHKMLDVNGVLMLFGGNQSGTNKDDVYKSVDGGATWTQVRASGAANGFGARSNFAVWYYDSKLWVAGGQNGATYYNDVWYSTDGGATWTQATASAAWGTRRYPSYWNYAGKMWIGFGTNGTTTHKDVFYSTDGINWSTATTNAACGQLYAAGHCVFAGKMWISGGYLSSSNNNVYYSTDGATWTQATAGAAWSARHNHVMTTDGVRLYVFAGTDGLTSLKDIYSSTDGVTWTSVGSSLSALNRWAYDGLFCNGNLVASGGYNGSYLNDVVVATLSMFDLDTAAGMNDYARIDAASGSVYGITVGTDTTNFGGSDTHLLAPIADGSGSGELDYGDMTDPGRLSEPTVSGSDNIMRLERDFTNSSGGSITIKEVGLSAKGLDALGLLLMRGKVDKAVADGASVRVAIELETSV